MGYKNEKLWELLEKKSVESDRNRPEDIKNSHQFITGVDQICHYAINRAKAIRDTFPTYTLHDETHICNVLRLMKELLGSRISDLTRDEIAMLIISACCHDIGMSYNDDDKQEALSNRDRLDKYLEARPAEYVKAYENNPDEPVLTEAMLQNYFRCIHHERVQDLLYAVEWPSILNGSVDREDLIRVCQSHGENVSTLADLNATPTVDLRMCAILLRLADILDFDTTRVPRSLYDYEKIATVTNSVTQDEWEKHYSANGFNFEATNRDQPYPLPFSANCKSMQIEHIVQSFLNWIDSELDECAKVISRHTGRWQNLMLPEKVERRIIPEGYVSGEYHLTLDHDQVLDLLAGRDLYGDPSVFVRELLQNAIDSVRTRCELDKNRPRNWKPQINIRTWTDAEGYQWFRIEDNGIGMSEETIRNYFLKIGCSYYNSNEFRKDKLRNNANPDFTPISRFGIGILSCFIGGDQIEVSTKRFKDSNGNYPGYRLKMQGMNGYFYLADFSKSHQPGPMKGVTVDECYAYRREAGTIVAVRTNLYKSGVYSGFKEIVSKYLLYPSVPVHYTGPDGTCDFLCEQDFIDAVHNLPDSTEGRFEFGLSSTQMEQLNHAMPGFEWDEPPKAVVHCAVFDRFLPSQFLNGAVVSAWATGHTKNKVTVNIGERKLNLSIIFTLEFDAERKALKLKFNYDLTSEIRSELEHLRGSSYDYLYYNYDFDSKIEHDKIISNRKKIDAIERISKIYEFVIHEFAKTSWLSALFCKAIGKCVIVHNGIVAEKDKDILTGKEVNLGAIILLKDKYRPNIDISRNNVNSLNAATAIVLSLLEEEMLRQGIKVRLDLSELDDAKYRYIPLALWFDILRDMEDISDYLMIETETEEFRSLNELLTIVKSEGAISLSPIYISNYSLLLYTTKKILANRNILKHVTFALLQRHFKCVLLDDHKIQIELPRGDEVQNIDKFPAMFFVNFSRKHRAKFAPQDTSWRYACNINHALSHWIISNQLALRERVPGILFELIRNVMEENCKEMIENVKRLLDIVKALPNNPIPVPDNIYLSKDDFY